MLQLIVVACIVGYWNTSVKKLGRPSLTIFLIGVAGPLGPFPKLTTA